MTETEMTTSNKNDMMTQMFKMMMEDRQKEREQREAAAKRDREDREAAAKRDRENREAADKQAREDRRLAQEATAREKERHEAFLQGLSETQIVQAER